jgi:hypothetical protein
MGQLYGIWQKGSSKNRLLHFIGFTDDMKYPPRNNEGTVSPSANPVWRILVPYIPFMSMMVIGHSLLY